MAARKTLTSACTKFCLSFAHLCCNVWRRRVDLWNTLCKMLAESFWDHFMQVHQDNGPTALHRAAL
jgi:hypothetical protein